MIAVFVAIANNTCSLYAALYKMYHFVLPDMNSLEMCCTDAWHWQTLLYLTKQEERWRQNKR